MMLASWEDHPYDLERWPEAKRQTYLAACPAFDPATSRGRPPRAGHPRRVPAHPAGGGKEPSPFKLIRRARRARRRPFERPPLPVPPRPELASRQVLRPGREGATVRRAFRQRHPASSRRAPGGGPGQARRPLPDAGPTGRGTGLARLRGARHHPRHCGLARRLFRGPSLRLTWPSNKRPGRDGRPTRPAYLLGGAELVQFGKA